MFGIFGEKVHRRSENWPKTQIGFGLTMAGRGGGGQSKQVFGYTKLGGYPPPAPMHLALDGCAKLYSKFSFRLHNNYAIDCIPIRFWYWSDTHRYRDLLLNVCSMLLQWSLLNVNFDYLSVMECISIHNTTRNSVFMCTYWQGNGITVTTINQLSSSSSPSHSSIIGRCRSSAAVSISSNWGSSIMSP